MAFYECPFHPYAETVESYGTYGEFEHSATLKGYVTSTIEVYSKIIISKAMLGAGTMSNRTCIVSMDGSTSKDPTKTKLVITGISKDNAETILYQRAYATSAIDEVDFNTGNLDFDYVKIEAYVKRSKDGNHRTSKKVTVKLW